MQLGLDLIIKIIEQGVDLDLLLSKRNAYYDNELLNDWDLHYLHLGTTLELNKFVSKTGPVLFARFDEQSAYLINVWNPGSWTNQDMYMLSYLSTRSIALISTRAGIEVI